MAACRTPRLYLAPMMNRTTTFFRSLVRILSPSPSTVLYTQMFAANAIIRMKEMDETSEGGSGGSSLLSSVLSSHIQFEPRQHPVVVQLGGSDAEQMAAAAKLCERYGYTDGVNINCGCPSPKVAGKGRFGAALMLDPAKVKDVVEAVRESISGEVSVKCRIGVDDADSYAHLAHFIETVSSSGCVGRFDVHARKAWLNGLSPSQNRAIPPLKYEVVGQLARDFPSLSFSINGGIDSHEKARQLVEAYRIDGVMVGRDFWKRPAYWRATASSGSPADTRTLAHIIEEYAAEAHRILLSSPRIPTSVAVMAVANVWGGVVHGTVWNSKRFKAALEEGRRRVGREEAAVLAEAQRRKEKRGLLTAEEEAEVQDRVREGRAEGVRQIVLDALDRVPIEVQQVRMCDLPSLDLRGRREGK
uniref:DUS-like FMN-binding domain-containing protein n=1 Tax=Palpitomonas bilix TaxID=652834 RepID=A0A7S3G776_9EUKA|mmetsp:Transcript_35342/g.91892  ORF Transcript_35342/g.91892 Transcript_35342/m.91892 type:complete len:416 (+) Transcript_35342:61-1308(+)|eukprot:CAMPEP_0113880490 /NCGR_PEP_ID=MMETSP0780_2-20120614/7816_1 /TAXON_ID=652834 /ORGANISM="Palpitomonas bilix" /LENGTH=415 /DNA_ID=CAMNT_0000867175 /DNA_START=53 /DNA_END=1300 /DNA_ORIENTATION=- /assembly_acc=CAM_ASM_000599